MIIRPARHDDLATVRALLVDSFERDHGYGYRPDWHADLDDLAGCYLERPGAQLLVAEVDGQVTGSVALKPEPPRCPEALEGHWPSGGSAELVRLVVAPEARRRGIASELVAALVDRARGEGWRVLCLHTNADNPHSVGFWRAQGAVEVYDEHQSEYHALHMEIPLR